MAKHVTIGASIECQNANIAVRKISYTPTLVKISGRNLFKYKTNIRAILEIVDELSVEERDSLICKHSILNENDVIEGDVIEIYLKNRMKKFDLTSNFSHVHTIQQNPSRCFTYAKIAIPWKFVLEQFEQKQI